MIRHRHLVAVGLAIAVLALSAAIATAAPWSFTRQDAIGDGHGGLDIAKLVSKRVGDNIVIELRFTRKVKNRKFRNVEKANIGLTLEKPKLNEVNVAVQLSGVSHGTLRAYVVGTSGPNDSSINVRRPGPKVMKFVFPAAWVSSIKKPQFGAYAAIGGTDECPKLGLSPNKWGEHCTDANDQWNDDDKGSGGDDDGPPCEPGQESTLEDPCSS
jgi:hypothetical protein